jgi:hypothetical protein
VNVHNPRDRVHRRTLLAVADKFLGVGCSLITSLLIYKGANIGQPKQSLLFDRGEVLITYTVQILAELSSEKC